MKKPILIIIAILLSSLFTQAQNAQRIQPYKKNHRHWQYKGEPVMLIGGSKEDNLFQIPDLEDHLDLMQQVGANYVRNTMSSRDEGNVWPFKQLSSGKYDLSQWNPEYWERFETFLEETQKREIFVQIELWDKWDFFHAGWDKTPWHPESNVNYSFKNTKVKDEYGDPMLEVHDFFRSVPEVNDDEVLLKYQRRFIEKLLSYSLDYDHVLYCIDNEIHPSYPQEWSLYWARLIHRKALEAGTHVEVTEMFWTKEMRAKEHRLVLENPEIFTFFDAAQNTVNKIPWEHWRNLQWVRYALKEDTRPINIVKIYSGRNQGPDRMWRHVIGGTASSRFHRPNSGIGLNKSAQSHIKSLRMWLEGYDIFTGQPDGDPGYGGGHHLLTDREREEAWCHYREGQQYSVYFPEGGDVGLELPDGNYTVRWLNIEQSNWVEKQQVEGGEAIPLSVPGGGHWLVLVTKKD